MLHEIGVELDAELKAKGCSLRVVDGPEQTATTTYARERIVIQHDEDSGDGFGPPVKGPTNPKSFMIRAMGAKITIYAQSGSVGAREYEHRRRAEHVLDLVLVAMHKVASKRLNQWRPTGGKFIQPDDLKASETVGGAVYELKFTFDRGVTDRDWAGNARPEVTIGTDVHIASITKASRADEPNDTDPGIPPPDAETV